MAVKNTGSSLRRQQARQREAEAWALRQKGWSEQKIASFLGISQPTVSRMLARVESVVISELSDMVTRVKVEQTYQLEHIISEALDGWERSKGERRQTVSKGVRVPSKKGDKDGQGATPEATVTQLQTASFSRDGNPAFLDQAMRALSEIRRIWGIGTLEDALSGGLTGGAVSGLPPVKEVQVNINLQGPQVKDGNATYPATDQPR